jgi:predicted amidohydrolase
MHNMFGPYPGLEERLRELSTLVDRMAEEAEGRFRTGLDIAALPEMAVTGGRHGSAADVSVPLEGPVLDAMGAVARKHRCHVVVTLHLAEGREGPYSNAAVILDRDGKPAGVYRKVFVVVDRGERTAEGGITPGREFPVFPLDFGRVGVQICYDMAFDDGWEELARKGTELVIWPSQWPGQVHPAARALRHRLYVLSSTWRTDACLTDPTGHTIREIRDRDGVFVEQIDLDYEILSWQGKLRNGAAFDERFGTRAGYRYSQMEDCGIFWSNDPAVPVADMVRELGLETREEELRRARATLDSLRGGPPRRG